MKKHYLILKPILILLLVILTKVASAQVTAGPTATTPIPTATTDADKIICYGAPISLSGPTDPAAGGADFAKYHWYKINSSGVAQEATAQTGRTYTEASGAAGYYNYQLVTENANGCLSPISNVVKVYVLPLLTVSITAPTPSMCAVASNTSLLTAVVTPAAGYVINYQWTLGGVDIPGATASTYTVTGQTTPATLTYGVRVAYALNASCQVTSTQNIVIMPLPTKPLITAN